MWLMVGIHREELIKHYLLPGSDRVNSFYTNQLIIYSYIGCYLYIFKIIFKIISA